MTAFPLLLKPAARYLALAGDIGRPDTDLYKSFIDFTARNWDHVFLVAGNHEYYARTQPSRWKYSTPNHYFETHELIKKIVSAYKNVTFLHHDNPSIYLAKEKLAIVGSTLWTHIGDEYKYSATDYMNDYKLIPFEDGDIRPLSPMDTNIIHAKEKRMLESQIDYWGTQKTQVCVITHHMPSFTLISPRYKDSPLNYCFASNCEDLMKPHVRAWIYGHTHNVSTGIINNTICSVNARGYPHEIVPGYSREAWIEFQTNSNDDSISDELATSSLGISSPLCSLNNV